MSDSGEVGAVVLLVAGACLYGGTGWVRVAGGLVWLACGVLVIGGDWLGRR